MAETAQYLVPAASSQAEIKVKGSRFIATIGHSPDRIEAEKMYLDYKKKYYNATHNCLAYFIRPDDFRFSDDGEPSGTAGRPIFQVLEKSGVQEIFCVVTRYFGGIKLGTGGLIKAYTEAAQAALSQLQVRIITVFSVFETTADYLWESKIRHLVTQFNGEISAADYDHGLRIEARIPASSDQEFIRQIIEQSNGQIVCRKKM